MTKKAKTPEDIRMLKVRTKLLPCKLNDEELLKYGSELGAVIQDVTAEEDQQISLKQDMKARLTSLEAERTALATKITRQEELRNVEVQPAIDFNKGVYREIRVDTGELIFERPVTDEERQEYIQFDEPSC